MKHFFSCLLAVLLIASLTGCDRPSQPQEQENQTIQQEIPDKQPENNDSEKPKPENNEEKQEQSNTLSSAVSQQSAEKETEKKPEQPQSKPQNEETQSASASSSSAPLPFPQELMQRPAEEFKNNPNQLDTRLYSVFKNVMEQNFERKKGTLSVYRLNFDGTEGAYELTFDLSNAYDEEGRLNKRNAIEAQMKVAETMQSGYNYGQGSRENYKSYEEYRKTLDWLKTPLLCEGFALKYFSDLTLTSEGGHYLIEATYSPEGLQELYGNEIYGTVQSFIQIDKDGNLEVLQWEQTEIIDDYPTVTSCSKYTFSE